MDTVVKLILIFFISLFSFAVGTFVGKGISDSEYRQLALENGDFNGFRGTASVNPHDTEVAPEQALNAEDIASLTEEFVNTEKKKLDNESNRPDAHGGDTVENEHTTEDLSATAPNQPTTAEQENGYKKMDSSREVASAGHQANAQDQTPSHKNQSAKHQTPNKANSISEAAQRVAMGKAPSKDIKQKRKPDSVLPSVAMSAVGKYTVQIASYPSEDEATKHAAMLKAKGFGAFYVPAEIKGRTWFRVSVGLYSNLEKAQAFRTELMKQADIKSAIVQKIIK